MDYRTMQNSRKAEVMAIYFPSWHPDKHYEKWYGEGFSEWELVKSTKPLFAARITERTAE